MAMMTDAFGPSVTVAAGWRCVDRLFHGSRAIVAAACAVIALPLAAQTPFIVTPLATPNVDIVRAARVDGMLRTANGEVLVGGLFTRVGSVARNGTARLQSDGQLDTGFVASALPNAIDFVVDSSGRLYAMNIGGLVRLLADGSRDNSFPIITPVPGGSLRELEIVDDKLIVAGAFTSIAGVTLSRMAKLDLAGVVDPTWAPAPNGIVLNLHAPGNGFIYAGGGFSQIGGQTRTGLARIAVIGNGTADAWAPLLGGTGSPNVRAMHSEGSALYVSGEFFTASGSNHFQIAKLDLAGTGAADNAWVATLSNAADMVGVFNGFVHVGRDSFSFNASNGAASLNGVRLARFAAAGTGALDTSFNPFADTGTTQNASVFALVPGDGGGRVLVGGQFSDLSNNDHRLSLAQLNSDGSLDTGSSVPEALNDGLLTSIAINTDGAVYLEGDFDRINNAIRRDLAKLTPAGLLDGAFRPAIVGPIALVPGDGVYVADNQAGRIRKLNASSGNEDLGFASIAYSNGIGAMTSFPPFIYATGSFQFTNAPAISTFGRFRPANASIDTTFDPTLDGFVSSFTGDIVSGDVYLSGSFTTVNGTPRAKLARLISAGTVLDAAWAPTVTGSTGVIEVDGNGGLWVSGGFTAINGQSCRAPARLLTATAVIDPTFSCARASSFNQAMHFANGAVYAAASDRLIRFPLALGGAEDPQWRTNVSGLFGLANDDQRLFAFGTFTSVSAQPRASLAAMPLVARYFLDGFE